MMTENERKQAIIKHLTRLREDIQIAQDICATNITTHLRALGFKFGDCNNFDLYDFIEKVTGQNMESFFSSVSYDIDSLCEDIIFNNWDESDESELRTTISSYALRGMDK